MEGGENDCSCTERRCMGMGMVMQVFLLRGRSEKEMDGLDRFLGFEIVRTEPNICWKGHGGFSMRCQSE